ncbi:MAG TPA: glycerophosphodiester phosphodiesterase [Ktedonobacterales bacterium]|nr:glycerophosphodiester phosphodiesterase [Ktedonobacterales bacterium]
MSSARRQSIRRPFMQHDTPLFFAHRGGSLLRPENTMPAFEHGMSFGADALELDIQQTRDGELVVIHDPTLDRTSSGSGPVASYSLDDLRAVDAGYRFSTDGGATFPYRGQGITIPTLRQVFERFPRARINIDLKESTPEREARLWALIQEFAAEDRVCAGCFTHATLVRFRRLTSGRVATSASPHEVRGFLLAALSHTTSWWLRPAYDALQVPDTYGSVRIISRTTVEAAHRLGIDVHVWTVDERSHMEALLALGVDGLMTDRPDILAEVLIQESSENAAQ